MENLRNHGELNDQDLASAPDYNVYEDDDGAVEAPPAIGQDERRMHVRAYNFWAGLLGERQFPSVEDLEPETDDDFGPNSVLLDFTDGFENPTIQFLGRALRDECEIDDSITSVADVPARSLLSRITDHYLQIIANQAPIGFEAEFVNQRGITIMYRGILLPFSTESLDEDASLADWLWVARNSANHAADCVERSRVTLYSAISQAYDFYLMTEQYPDDYQMLLEDSGLVVQDRAPMTPIVKLVFGPQYDKTRLTEYATALKYAQRNAIAKGALGNLLKHHDGGLKAIVHAERKANKPAGLLTKARAVGEDLLAKLRSAPSRRLQDIEAGDSEFVVLVARKDANGDLAIVGPVRGNDKLTGQALKHIEC